VSQAEIEAAGFFQELELKLAKHLTGSGSLTRSVASQPRFPGL